MFSLVSIVSFLCFFLPLSGMAVAQTPGCSSAHCNRFLSNYQLVSFPTNNVSMGWKNTKVKSPSFGDSLGCSSLLNTLLCTAVGPNELDAGKDAAFWAQFYDSWKASLRWTPEPERRSGTLLTLFEPPGKRGRQPPLFSPTTLDVQGITWPLAALTEAAKVCPGALPLLIAVSFVECWGTIFTVPSAHRFRIRGKPKTHTHTHTHTHTDTTTPSRSLALSLFIRSVLCGPESKSKPWGVAVLWTVSQIIVLDFGREVQTDCCPEPPWLYIRLSCAQWYLAWRIWHLWIGDTICCKSRPWLYTGRVH